MTNLKIKKISNYPEIEKANKEISGTLVIIGMIIILTLLLSGLLLLDELLKKQEETQQSRLPQIESLIDEKLIKAIGKLETQNCKIVVAKNNCYNIKGKNGKYVEFSSEKEATDYLIILLTRSPYYEKWRKTGNLEDLAKVYAEDPHYAWKLKSVLNNL